MKLYCIADEDTVRGFRLAGVSGEVAAAAPEAAAAVEAALAQGDCGVLILTVKTADSIRPLIEHIRFDLEAPLVIEIAGPEGALAGRKSLRELVQEAVGIELESEREIE